MNELNHIQRLQVLTQELQTLHSEIHSSTYSGRKYEVLSKLTEHREQVKEIFQRCVGEPALQAELDSYSQQIEVIKNLLPPLSITGEKITNTVHFKIFSINIELYETQIINKLSLAFHLSENEIREQLPNSPEGFFVDIANLCFDLANKRLYKSIPLDFDEIKVIYDALSDPRILKHRNEDDNVTSFIQPHPIDIFTSLYKFLNSVELFDSCEDIQNQMRTYLETKPVPSYGIAVFLNEDISQQKRTLEQIQKMARDEEEGAIDFINSLEIYQNQLSSFKKGLKDLPIVDVKAILEDSININHTYFLNVDGKVNWVFKPSSMNEKGDETIQAECTASQLNYHHQFPIPLTIPLMIKDWVGSAQVYVENTKKLTEIEKEGTFIDVDLLQRLAIFDLLFANSDRNEENFIFQNLNDLARIVGIDHDRCLMFKQIEELKMDYLQHQGMRKPINEELSRLFSFEAIQAYKVIMMENQVPIQMFEWIDVVGEELNKAVENKTPLKIVVIRLQNKYRETF